MKLAYIMRGIPGSGKSTVAQQLAGEVGQIHSTDDYFYVDGEYRFDPSKLGEYHARNLEAFCACLDAGVPIVICDKTNIKIRDFCDYVKAAEKAGYQVVYVILPHPTVSEAARRNIHGVPHTTIERMIYQWEH